MYFLVVLLTSISLGTCQSILDQPRISYISRSKTKSIGDDVEFNCTVENNIHGYPVLWIKLDHDRSDRATLSTNHNKIIQDGRFSVSLDSSTSTYTLKIHNLREPDIGFYQCQVLIDVSNKITSEVELQIKRSPTINWGNTTSEYKQSEFGSVELKCNADGYPLPTITWKRKNDALFYNGGTTHIGNILQIPKIHREDRGIYFCYAENGVGLKAQANITVKVEFKPNVLAIRPKIGQALGYSATLECLIESYPGPSVSWWKNGKTLSNDVYQEIEENNEYKMIYTIEKIDPKHFGEYICQASNNLGESRTKIQLFETSIPVCSGPCR